MIKRGHLGNIDGRIMFGQTNGKMNYEIKNYGKYSCFEIMGPIYPAVRWQGEHFQTDKLQ